MSFFEELKRRNVIRVGIAYAVASWLLLQLTEVLIELLELSPQVGKYIILFLIIGFIPALIFAWAFEMTPEGLKRESEVDRSESITPKTARKLDRTIIGVLLLALVWFAFDKFKRPAPVELQTPQIAQQVAEPEVATEPSIAVLPFTDLSQEKDQEYFSDGIAEELLNLLVRVDGLKVASRTSSFSYKGNALSIAEIADELKVDHILEGSVRKAENRVRITAQLIDAKTDRHLWSDTYDRELEDIFGIQDDIANAIVDSLRAELGVLENSGPISVDVATENLDAYQLFLEARSLFVARLDLPRAVALFERAVALDPEFARAWAELSANYSVMESWGNLDRDYSVLAAQAADRALELDPSLSTPWAVKGQLARDSGDEINGVVFTDKAIELDPENATHHLWQGINLSGVGFQEQSIRSLERCLEIDPAYENCRRHLAITHMLLGHNDKMIELFQQGTEAGFRGSSTALFSRFMTLGNRMLAAQILFAGEEQVSSLPARAILDAAEFPERDHSRGLAKFRAWLENTGEAPGGYGSIFAIFKDYESVEPAPFSNRWIWAEEFRDFRQSEYFKPFVRKIGLPEYWFAQGFPPTCRAVGSDDFKCD